MSNTLFETAIPDEKLAAVRKALSAAFGSCPVDDIQLTGGGLSTALVYRLRIDNKGYLLRIITDVSELNDPHRQYICMNAAAAAGIAPRVYYTNEEDAVAITDFITAIPLRNGFSSPDILIKELANTVKTMHALPLFPKLVNFMDGVDLFIRQFRELNMLPGHVTDECFDLYAEVQKHYPRYDTDLVSSHNDLNPNNILFDGKKIWVIDWEAAFQNDRYTDLAIIAKSYTQGQQQEDLLLATYFGEEPGEYRRARFYLMQQACHMYYAMAMLKLAAAAKPAGYLHDANMLLPDIRAFHIMIGSRQISLETYEAKLQYGKILLNTMLANMQSERFKQAVSVVVYGG